MAVYRLSDTYSTTPIGLVHIVTTTFSAASAVNVNGCFTSVFDNYRILVSLTGTADVAVTMRMRLAGTDNSASSYTFTLTRAIYSASALASRTPAGWGGTTTMWEAIEAANGAVRTGSMDIYGAALAAHTGYTATVNASGNGGVISTGYHAVATAYDGFGLTPSSGTVTGSLVVLGYAKS